MQCRVRQPTCRLYLGARIHQPVVVVVARQLEAVLHHHPTSVVSSNIDLTYTPQRVHYCTRKRHIHTQRRQEYGRNLLAPVVRGNCFWKYITTVQTAFSEITVDRVNLVKVLHSTQHGIGQFGDVLPSQSLDFVLKTKSNTTKTNTHT